MRAPVRNVPHVNERALPELIASCEGSGALARNCKYIIARHPRACWVAALRLHDLAELVA